MGTSELQAVTEFSIRGGAYCPADLNEQARAIQFYEVHSDEFLYAISGDGCLSLHCDPNAYEVFEEVVARQNSFSSQPYKRFQIMVGDNQVIVADKDNDGLLDHFSVNEFNTGDTSPIILDGNEFDPLISSILEYSREPSDCSDERLAEKIGVSFFYSLLAVASIVVCFFW